MTPPPSPAYQIFYGEPPPPSSPAHGIILGETLNLTQPDIAGYCPYLARTWTLEVRLYTDQGRMPEVAGTPHEKNSQRPPTYHNPIAGQCLPIARTWTLEVRFWTGQRRPAHRVRMPGRHTKRTHNDPHPTTTSLPDSVFPSLVPGHRKCVSGQAKDVQVRLPGRHTERTH